MENILDAEIENSPPLAVGSPPSSKSKKHGHHHSTCQNCGAELIGAYCHACGQGSHVHRSLLHVLEEVVHGITHFDSRAWRSIPMLFFRPGTLTRNYVMGHRARYVPPFGMFLASIFVLFLGFSFVGGPGIVSEQQVSKAQLVQDARERVTNIRAQLKGQDEAVATAKALVTQMEAQKDPPVDAADLTEARADLASEEADLKDVQGRLALAEVAVRTALASKETKAVSVEPTVTLGGSGDRETALKQIQRDRAEALAKGDKASQAALDAAEAIIKIAPADQIEIKGDRVDLTTDTTVEKNGSWVESLKQQMRDGSLINTPWPHFDEKIHKKMKNPDLFLYKLQNTVYKFFFLLIPLSLPFFWVMLFWKKDVALFDHAVFALYSVSFMSFLFLGASLLAQYIGWSQVAGWMILAAFIHLYFQFKGAYSLGWFSAFWRTCIFGLVFAPISIALFLSAIVYLGATG